MPPKRRPAAAEVRRGVLRRPAAAPVAVDRGWQNAGEIGSDTLLGWPWVHLKGRFWDEDVELIGKVMEIKMRDTGRELVMKGSGTPSESLLKALTGIPSRQLRVHLCGDPCEALVLCALQSGAGGSTSRAWVEPEPGSGWWQRRGGRAAAAQGVRGGVERERKRSWRPASKGEEERKVSWYFGRRGQKEEKEKEEGLLEDPGKKGLDSLFASTGLDPKPEIRRKVKRKARKVARRSRNKKRGSSSSGSESSSSTSRESAGIEDKDLFEPATPTQRVWKLCPGALTGGLINTDGDSLRAHGRGSPGSGHAVCPR